jgi:hypothetical protein
MREKCFISLMNSVFQHTTFNGETTYTLKFAFVPLSLFKQLPTFLPTYLPTYIHNCHPDTLYNLHKNCLPAYQPNFLGNIHLKTTSKHAIQSNFSMECVLCYC